MFGFELKDVYLANSNLKQSTQKRLLCFALIKVVYVGQVNCVGPKPLFLHVPEDDAFCI
jgi:hypothetical protein